MSCLFCKIAAGDIPATKVYEDAQLLAFRDIDPKAPTHILVIPKRHIPSVNALEEADNDLIGRMVRILKGLAKEEGIAESGYRIVVNTNADGGQTVDHLHFHLLGGRSLTWPPG